MSPTALYNYNKENPSVFSWIIGQPNNAIHQHANILSIYSKKKGFMNDLTRDNAVIWEDAMAETTLYDANWQVAHQVLYIPSCWVGEPENLIMEASKRYLLAKEKKNFDW